MNGGRAGYVITGLHGKVQSNGKVMANVHGMYI